MKRITPDEVVAAYKATGLKPETYSVKPCDSRVCAAGVLDVQHGHSRAYDYLQKRAGKFYTMGVFSGFDGATLEMALDGLGEECRHDVECGFHDGVAIREACIKEFGEF